MTAQRLAATIPSRRCSTLDVSDTQLRHARCDWRYREDVSVVVGIHAFRAGRLLVNSQVPYVIVLGGTDMNVHLREPDKRAIMEKALARAGSIVAFNAELLRTLLEAMPAIARQKTFLAAQATRVSVTRPLPADRAQLVRAAFDLRDGERLLLLPAGLRPVKDMLPRERSRHVACDRFFYLPAHRRPGPRRKVCRGRALGATRVVALACCETSWSAAATAAARRDGGGCGACCLEVRRHVAFAARGDAHRTLLCSPARMRATWRYLPPPGDGLLTKAQKNACRPCAAARG